MSKKAGDFQWLRLHASTAGVVGGNGAHVQSLVGEIISSMLFGRKKKKGNVLIRIKMKIQRNINFKIT